VRDYKGRDASILNCWPIQITLKLISDILTDKSKSKSYIILERLITKTSFTIKIHLSSTH